MKLNKLSLRDKQLFTKYLGLDRHDLSVFAFANLYIWSKLFDIEWGLIENSLCIFFKDRLGCFLYLPPLVKKINKSAIDEAFKIMDSLNKNTEISRIENIEEKDLDNYRKFGFECKIKSYDYICERSTLVELRGDSFKSKRASLNYFLKHYQFELSPITASDKESCLDLYKQWMSARLSKNSDSFYRWMMEDSLKSLKEALDNYTELGFEGMAVRINNELKGFTFGYKLNKDTFCILYEIADLSAKGLAQLIFKEFSISLSDYKYINIMDDSGLANLKKVKLSYHPRFAPPAYIATRKL